MALARPDPGGFALKAASARTAKAVARPMEADPLESLIARVRDGDLGAFDALYRRTRNDVQRVLYQLVGSNADMEDLVQESLTLMAGVPSLPFSARW